MMAIYSCINMVSDRCQLPINWWQYLKGQSDANMATGTILQTPYIQHLGGTVDSPRINDHNWLISTSIVLLQTLWTSFNMQVKETTLLWTTLPGQHRPKGESRLGKPEWVGKVHSRKRNKQGLCEIPWSKLNQYMTSESDISSLHAEPMQSIISLRLALPPVLFPDLSLLTDTRSY